MPKLTAFVARSFSPEDDQRIGPILEFLRSFRAAGFLADSAEQADVESVSKKVRDMIDTSDVFVGIFTRRYPVYDPASLYRGWLPFGRRKPTVERWVAPPWVIQESGYALKSLGVRKKMILFRESGVELPSLQGDLEYIDFEARNFAPAFQKASEMVNSLLSENSGTVVETIVRSNSPTADVPTEPAATDVEAKIAPPGGLIDHILAISAATEAKDWGKARKAYENGLAFLKENDPEKETFFKALYHRWRYCEGDSDGLESLRILAAENPVDPEPLSAMGSCFDYFHEYDEAADYYLKASRLAKGRDAVHELVYAARALNQAGKREEAIRLLLDASRAGAHEINLRKELYALLKSKKEFYAALAVAERTLAENPGASDLRFSVAYDCEDQGFSELSIFHYRIMRKNDSSDKGALNNLGVSYSSLALPILSVDSYREAYKNGNTLAADNLARRYLESGFVSDAAALANEAMKHEDYEPRLPRTLGAVDENRKQEEIREKSFLEGAEKHRQFLAAFGEGFLENAVSLDGTWKFPEAEISLRLARQALEGDVELTMDVSPLAGGAFGLRSDEKQERKRIHFGGEIHGRTCTFRMRTEVLPGSPPGSMTSLRSLLGAGQTEREGRIVFSSDGKTGKVCDLKDGKPSDFYSITRIS